MPRVPGRDDERGGALSSFLSDRRQALWQVRAVARAARERWLPGLQRAIDPPVTLPPLTPADELILDRRALGLAAGRHVLDLLRPRLVHRPLQRAIDLAALPTGARVEVAGQLISRQQPGTAHGVVFLTLTDETGFVNVVVLPPVYAQYRAVVRGEVLLWLQGLLERRDGGLTLRAVWLRHLQDALGPPIMAPTANPPSSPLVIPESRGASRGSPIQ